MNHRVVNEMDRMEGKLRMIKYHRKLCVGSLLHPCRQGADQKTENYNEKLGRFNIDAQ